MLTLVLVFLTIAVPVYWLWKGFTSEGNLGDAVVWLVTGLLYGWAITLAWLVWAIVT